MFLVGGLIDRDHIKMSVDLPTLKCANETSINQPRAQMVFIRCRRWNYWVESAGWALWVEGRSVPGLWSFILLLWLCVVATLQ
jgi:hypothetical protein